MKSSGWGKRAWGAVIGGLALAVFAGAAGQSASAARVQADRPAPQTFLLKLDEPSTVRVFRQNRDQGLPEARAAAKDQKSDITGAQSEVIDDLPANADPIYRTHSVLAAVGVTAPAGDKTLLEQIPGVSAVYPVAPKSPTNDYAVPFQAAAQAWQSTGFLGQGQTIAVIDTGVDYTHSNFGGPGTETAFETAQATEDQPANPALFPNAKVSGGIDLVGDDYDSDSDSENYQPDPHPDPNPLDCGGHGSHVAGSAAGYGVKADGSTYDGVYDNSTDFAAMKIGPGMAPRAKVYAIKVFGCDGSTDVVTEAIDRAVDPNNDGDPTDHVDVINMSLGSDFGSVQDGDSVASNAAVQMGVSVVASAGNSGDISDITGSPGDASQVLSVASSVDAESKVDGAEVTIDGNQDLYAITRSGRYDWKTGPDLSGPVVAAPVENETACAPYTGTPFTGKVVLVKWHDAVPECGSITRGDNLAAAGAIGFIFGSDAETFSAGINGDDAIPGVLMAKSGADAIRDALDNSLAVSVDGTEVNAVTRSFPDDNDKISSFTSRGIHATGNVKPDVTAVGSSVFSTAVGTGDDGVSFSGTSMASPMVAGLAALVRQANPGWTPLQVKADIMNTAAHDLFVDGSANPSSDRYGPPRVGSGRIDAALATGNRVLAYDPANGAVSVSFGPVAASAPVTLSREVKVENQSSFPVTYDLAYDPINEVPGAEFSVTPSQVSLDPGRSTMVTVSLAIEDPSQLTKAVDPTAGRFSSEGDPRETLAEAFGRLLLEPTGPGTTLRVPVYASPRPASDMGQPASLLIHRSSATAGDPEQTASLELAGQGLGSGPGENGVGDGDPDNDIFSIAAGFELQATSGESPECDEEIETSCWRLPEEKYADLKLVGYTSNAPLVADPDQQLAYFAAAVQAPWAIPADKAAIQFDLDVDGDGTPDLFLYNDRLGEDDVFVSTLLDPSRPEGQRIIDQQLVNGRFGDIDTALYDSDALVLPVSLAALADYGIDADNPRVSYGVETYSYSSDQAIDMIGVNAESGDLENPLSANLFEPGILVTGDGGVGPLVEDQPGEQLTVTRNVASYRDDAGLGVLMLHFHNPVGDKAQVVALTGAESATELSTTPGKLTAKVKAVGDGLPEPSGEVTFSVDGTEVGSATVEDGSAILKAGTPHGGVHQIKAEYEGDADFAASSDQFERTDPGLTARIKTPKSSFGWYRKPVDIYFRCVTHGSELTQDCPYPRRLGRDGRGQQVKASITALDGGKATVTVSGINIDRTAPRVKISGVRRGASYPRIRRARCVGRDRLSGLASCGIRWKRRGKRVIYTATGVDRAGNRRTVRTWVRITR